MLYENPEAILDFVAMGGGASFGFFVVRWLLSFIAGRVDKREAQIDAGTKSLIQLLQNQVNELASQVTKFRADLDECKRQHDEARREVMELRGLLQGIGDAREHAQLIVSKAANKKDDK